MLHVADPKNSKVSLLKPGRKKWHMFTTIRALLKGNMWQNIHYPQTTTKGKHVANCPLPSIRY